MNLFMDTFSFLIRHGQQQRQARVVRFVRPDESEAGGSIGIWDHKKEKRFIKSYNTKSYLYQCILILNK